MKGISVFTPREERILRGNRQLSVTSLVLSAVALGASALAVATSVLPKYKK